MGIEPPTRLERYLSIETIGGASWKPDNKAIAFVSNLTGVYQVYHEVIDQPVIPTRLTTEEDRCTDPRYLSDGSILFVRDRGGDENFQLGLIKDTEIFWLTSQLDVKHRVSYTSENAVYYMANIEDRARLDLYRRSLPLQDNDPEILYQPQQGLVSAQLVSDDQNSVVLVRFRGNADHDLMLLDLQTSEVAELTAGLTKGRPTRWEAIRWLSRDALLVSTDFESDYQRLAVLNLNNDFMTLPEIEENLRWKVQTTTWSKSSDKTYYINNEEGYARLYSGVFNPDGVDDHHPIDLSIKASLVSGDARSFSRGMRLSPDGKKLAITLSSPIYPSTIWVLEIDSGKNVLIKTPDTVGLKTEDFVDCQLVRIESYDGLSVPYFRYIPQGETPSAGWPAILMIHGGPESQILPSFNPVLQFFLSAGFAVITPNIRGSSGYGKTYLDLDNIEKRLDSILDIKQIALNLKSSDPEINGDRLVIYGGSYGGFAVLSAMTEHPNLWKAGVDIVGISNFVTFLENTASWRRGLRESEYGSLKKDMDTLVRISPIHNVDRIQAPLFIIQGDNDERVPLSESLQIYDKVKSKGIPVELLRYADEGHGLAKLENRIDAYSKVLEWLREIV
ncbi:MAG: S9 family peptidase [Candidatus Thorarchaeota archaeon]